MRNRLILSALMAAFLSVPPVAQAEVGNSPETLALAGILDNDTFDRAGLSIGHRAQYWMPVFDTLLYTAPDGKTMPNLATEWRFNGDGTELTLKLREGVKFTDGMPFDAEAVKANLEYLRDGVGQNTWMAGAVKSVEIVGPAELKLHLKEPDPGMLFNLATVGGAMASPATLGKADSKMVPIGSGPYIYDTARSVTGRQYVYKRNPDYWNAGAFPFETMTITPINDLSARMNALKSGQVDAAAGEGQVVTEAEASKLTVSRLPVDWLGLFLSDRDGKMVKALSDVRVRRALNMAFDEKAILKFVARGYGEVTDQPFVPPSEAFDASLDGTYQYDPKAARALLSEAGYANGFSVTMPDIGTLAPYTPIITQQLKDIGVTVSWVKVPPNVTIAELLSGKYPMFLFRLGSQSPWADFNKFAFANSPWNTSKAKDEKLEALLKKAQYTPPGKEQNAAMQAANRYMVENAFFAPWFRIDSIYISNAQVKVRMQAQNIVPWPRNYAPAK
ncbi:ABC transporter substrate-binding protein [Neorhizobium sp. LjRoot104]|uniref:ABC transporter substrate-binding protein n=1 Tax=Neorhizobium sp. LjRoot104 TaxID=3342254 RepID=UPI003ECD5437